MNQFICYIGETLHLDVDATMYMHADKLPLYLSRGYDLYSLTIQNVECLLAQPKDKTNLTAVRKQIGQMKKLTGLDCVLCLERARIYTKEKMVSEGIPFIIAGQQLYMPFLGVALSKTGMRDIPSISQISFSTQKLVLTAIYDGWTQLTLTEAANALHVSKMTVTRCFDELQALNLPLILTERKMRRFVWQYGRHALWEKVHPFLRNPITRQYRFSEQIDIDTTKLGGISAICYYSMLTDNNFLTYAVSKDAAKTLALDKLQLVPVCETPTMIIQVISYDINYNDNAAIDPLSAILSLSATDIDDPRVESAIDDILEDCLHD